MDANQPIVLRHWNNWAKDQYVYSPPVARRLDPVKTYVLDTDKPVTLLLKYPNGFWEKVTPGTKRCSVPYSDHGHDYTAVFTDLLIEVTDQKRGVTSLVPLKKHMAGCEVRLIEGTLILHGQNAPPLQVKDGAFA